MNLQLIALNKLRPASYNPRTMGADELEGLKESIKTFGQQENLIVNKDLTVISGHQRQNKALGYQSREGGAVPTNTHQRGLSQ